MNLRLYLDENFVWSAHVEVLRAGGFDVLSAGEAGMLQQADAAHLQRAAAEHRLLISYDRKDYTWIHAEFMRSGRTHAGILLVLREANYSPGELLRRMNALAAFFGDGGVANQLLFLSNFG